MGAGKKLKYIHPLRKRLLPYLADKLFWSGTSAAGHSRLGSLWAQFDCNSPTEVQRAWEKTHNRPIRIGYLTHGKRNHGGGEAVLRGIIKGISRRRFTPVSLDVEMDDGLTGVYRAEATWRHLRHVPALLAAVWRTALSIRENKIDILHPHDNLSKIIGGLACVITRTPCVAHCHDVYGGGFMDWLMLKVHRLLIDRSIAVSDHVADMLREHGIRAVHIENGVDVQAIGNSDSLHKIRPSEVVLGTVAMMDPGKDIKTLIDAVDILEDRGIRATCLIVGSGRAEQELRDYSGTKRGSFEFMGYLKDVNVALRRMDIFVMPSLKESFCLAVAEAMAAKVPVIATPAVTLVRHEQTGLQVPFRGAMNIAGAVERLMKDVELRNAMVLKARQMVADYHSLYHTVRKTEDLYTLIMMDQPRVAIKTCEVHSNA